MPAARRSILSQLAFARLVRGALLAPAAICAGIAGEAADFRVMEWRGAEVLMMTGPIDPGTARKFARARGLVAPMPHGYPVLLLSSGGGDIAEAMRMAEMMAETPFHTVVFNGARCASACAVVLFIAGALRTVDPGGALGQHSCASGSGIARQDCNERLAEFAMDHGVSHGSVAAFVTNVAPSDILWFSRQDADGWGLTRYPGSAEVGWQKSEPRVDKILFGEEQKPQGLWRLDFRGDGYEAFVRMAGDAERELELNLFCDAALPGRLFLSLEIHGPAEAVQRAVSRVTLTVDGAVHVVADPQVVQLDEAVSEVLAEIPPALAESFLTSADLIEFRIDMPEPYEPVVVRTVLAESRENLRFAAGHCMGTSAGGG